MIKKFSHAFKGLYIALNDFNIRLHFIFLILAIMGGFLFRISNTEWFAIIGISALVIALEIINSAIEELCNFISPQYHQSIKQIKDLSAAAVLIAAIAAIIIGAIIFLPKIFLK